MSKLTVEVRPLQASDRDAWLGMREQLWPGDVAAHIATVDDFLGPGLRGEVDAVLLAIAASNPVGFVELRVRDSAEGSSSARVPYVEGWFVDADARAKGVGAALMAAAEDWAIAGGYTELASDTELANLNSIAAHTALGFVEAERAVHFLKPLPPAPPPAALPDLQLQTIPIVRIFDDALAREFYCDWLGMTLDWEHRFEPGLPIYLQVSRAGLVLHLSEHAGDGTPGSKLFINVNDLDGLFADLSSRPYRRNRPAIETAPWGARTFELIDPFANRLLFNQVTA